MGFATLFLSRDKKCKEVKIVVEKKNVCKRKRSADFVVVKLKCVFRFFSFFCVRKESIIISNDDAFYFYPKAE